MNHTKKMVGEGSASTGLCLFTVCEELLS